MSRPTYLPLSPSPFPETDPQSTRLLDTFLRKSTWIWPEEGGFPAPLVPGSTQRAFRKTLTLPRQKPQSTTILITADNDFQLYVNGVLLHAADRTHPWDKPHAFTVPVPTSSDKIVYAIRAINDYADIGLWQPSPAGLRAAVVVHYADGTTSAISYTGQDETWLSERLFPEGWEQPEFDDGKWTPARTMPNAFANGPVWGNLQRPSEVLVATALPTLPGAASASASLPTSTAISPILVPSPAGGSLGDGSPGAQNAFASGEYAGFVVGLCLGAVLASTILTFVFSRRRIREGKEW